MRPYEILQIIRDTLHTFVCFDKKLIEEEAREHFQECVWQLENSGQTILTIHGPKLMTDEAWGKVCVEIRHNTSTKPGKITRLNVTQLALLNDECVRVLEDYLRKVFEIRGYLYLS
jgi:hypothetical protein